ncbi:segregation/condensation protein A [Botrimarina sp.]|uniref:segregation and condensation protein A n=1 Tax=Botrimarina sp. TaxID=2795802 RepID=UPI0032EFF245
MPAFRVQLDAYNGPLDLLLYLVRKAELPIAQLPLAELAQQYLDYVALVERLDPDAVGDFLEVASTLLVIKSQSVLPDAEASAGEPTDDEAPVESPGDLVARLLQYKEYRDAAARLETARLDWSRRRVRVQPTGRAAAPADERPIEGVELWDLVSAFARVMRDRLQPPEEPATVRYDETPIHVYMQRVDRQLRQSREPTPFECLFPEGEVHKSTLVAVFLAVLELVRYRHALASQSERFGPIALLPGPTPYAVAA